MNREALAQLQAKNPTLPLLPVTAPEFAEYGRLLPQSGAAFLKAAEALKRPAQGSEYLAGVPAFEALPDCAPLSLAVFGGLKTQFGYCHGHNSQLNAAEWHCCSELNIAVTNLVLILGRRSDLKNNWLNTKKMQAFYLPAGTVAEIYATTLHFCPCEVQMQGFGCVVGLPVGTNLPLPEGSEGQGLLFRQNKWLLAHEQNTALLQRGAVAGLTGENYTVLY